MNGGYGQIDIYIYIVPRKVIFNRTTDLKWLPVGYMKNPRLSIALEIWYGLAIKKSLILKVFVKSKF